MSLKQVTFFLWNFLHCTLSQLYPWDTVPLRTHLFIPYIFCKPAEQMQLGFVGQEYVVDMVLYTSKGITSRHTNA